MKYEHLLITHCSECRHAVPIEGYKCISCAANNGAVHAPDGYCDKGLPSHEELKAFDEKVRGGAKE